MASSLSGVSLQYRRYNNHVVLFSQFLSQNSSRSGLIVLCELHPRESLTSADKEGAVKELLQAKHIDPTEVSCMSNFLKEFMNSFFLLLHRGSCGKLDRVLYRSNTYDMGLSRLLRASLDAVPLDLKVILVSNGFCLMRNDKNLSLVSVENAPHFLELLLGDKFTQHILQTHELFFILRIPHAHIFQVARA